MPMCPRAAMSNEQCRICCLPSTAVSRPPLHRAELFAEWLASRVGRPCSLLQLTLLPPVPWRVPESFRCGCSLQLVLLAASMQQARPKA